MAVAVVGLLVLFAYAASEVLSDPSLTLEDGYWIGRVPWTPLGVGLVVAGTTAAIVLGYTVVMLQGGIVRRFAGAITVMPAAFWWVVELLQLQGVSGACPSGTCVRPWIDPITYAYSEPDWTIRLLLLPALIVATLALVPPRKSTRLTSPARQRSA
jgi:hypothetical protein